jgi:hypothetical protein
VVTPEDALENNGPEKPPVIDLLKCGLPAKKNRGA